VSKFCCGEERKTNFCPQCGKQLFMLDVRYCVVCGTKIVLGIDATFEGIQKGIVIRRQRRDKKYCSAACRNRMLRRRKAANGEGQ
jgi:hypothetical protein